MGAGDLDLYICVFEQQAFNWPNFISSFIGSLLPYVEVHISTHEAF